MAYCVKCNKWIYGENRLNGKTYCDECSKIIRGDKTAILLKALRDIIDECPNPNLPYGHKVVEIAKKAIEDINESWE